MALIKKIDLKRYYQQWLCTIVLSNYSNVPNAAFKVSLKMATQFLVVEGSQQFIIL